MSKKVWIMVAVVVVVALVIAGIIWAQRGAAPAVDNTNTPTDQSTPPSSESQSNGSSNNAQTVTISYTNNGFTPAQITIKSGDTVLVKNDSDEPLDFASDDHPTHTKQSELNIGDIEPGQSESFTATAKGTWGFHNHANAAHEGSIIVE